MQKENKARINCYSVERIDLAKYDNFVSKYGVIQQSSQWLKSRISKHCYPFVVMVENSREILGACGILYSKAFSNFLTGKFIIPGSPTLNDNINDKEKILEFLFSKIDEESKRRNVISIEWNTLWSQWKYKDILEKHNYQIKELKAWILNITNDEKEIYKKISSSHKRWINRAEKKYHITIYESNDVFSFYKLWKETYKRRNKNLAASTLRNLEQLYEFLAPKGMARIIFARKDNSLLCGNFVLYLGDTIYYLHGGSISGQRYGAPHLLHWNLIKNGIQKGHKYYHFGGSWSKYSDRVRKKHAMGIDEFKRRFGAIPITFYCGDKILSPFRHILHKKIRSLYYLYSNFLKKR